MEKKPGFLRSENYSENGILTYPPDFDPSKKYPLVLLIHGGPRAASMRTFSAGAQLMAAKGWLVFQPNYRGSDNLGRAYSNAINGDAGEGPGKDVMAGIEALKKRGIVDAHPSQRRRLPRDDHAVVRALSRAGPVDKGGR